MFALNPGCCCEPGETCTIYSDLFERSDSSSLGADWTEVVSDLEISSGAVIRTGGTNPFAISTTTHSSHEMRIDMTVEATTSGSKFRIIMGYVDTNNYYFAELTIGSNIVLYRRSGGTNTSIGSLSIFSATGSPFTWWACMRGSFFSSGIGDITDPATAVHSTTSGSSGFGWGSTTSGMQVHSITSSILSPSCAYCYGWSCDGVCDPSFEVPTQLRVTISGMANGDGSGGTPCGWERRPCRGRRCPQGCHPARCSGSPSRVRGAISRLILCVPIVHSGSRFRLRTLELAVLFDWKFISQIHHALLTVRSDSETALFGLPHWVLTLTAPRSKTSHYLGPLHLSRFATVPDQRYW